MNQLGTPVSIWNGLAVLFAYPGHEFRLLTAFGTALIQTPNVSCTEPNSGALAREARLRSTMGK